MLGANDGIVSTASLIIGVAAANAAADVLVAGVAGLVAGAMSMAAGETVSVSSQSDTEQADLNRERTELATQHAFEREELAQIYVARGVDPKLALQVADQMMAKDALGAHARDELWHFRGENSETDPGRADLGDCIFGWRSDAAGDGPDCTGNKAGRDCVDCLASVPCAAGCRWGESRRRQCAEGKRSRHILGRIGNGIYRWHRGRNRYCRLTQLPDLRSKSSLGDTAKIVVQTDLMVLHQAPE